MEINLAEQKRHKRIMQKNRLREFSDSIKSNNIYIIGDPEEKIEKKETQNLFDEVIAENFHNLRRETNIQNHEVQRNLIKINKRTPIPIYGVIRVAKYSNKEKKLKAKIQNKT